MNFNDYSKEEVKIQDLLELIYLIFTFAKLILTYNMEQTYPNIEFDIFVGNCLHVKTYGWYSCDRLAKFQFV